MDNIYKEECFHADQSYSEKMQFHIVLLVLVSFQQSTLGAYNRDIGLQRNLRSGNFFSEIGNWFGHLKDQFYGTLFGQQTTTEIPTVLQTDVLDLDERQLRKRLRNREWLRVNLSTVTFDPKRDWGFQVGDWYFIRKNIRQYNEFENEGSYESNFHVRGTMQPPVHLSTIETIGTSDYSINIENTDSSSAATLSTMFTADTMTQQADAYITTQSSTQIDSSVNPPSINKRIEDNETNDNSIRKGSVEVLME
ncbi:uncharacterized protein LOC116427830 isoform X2 [Nomia melanderi]|uniref:uncharacterized protein LOC116427830 isoform X2 n=1 Tax=Nomia melanderi TaxID=2448451 RepID=UPI0013043B59|nr:uncharacterized protein LOC116427830 isoform X2 [Nomia melanderi]